MGLGVRLKQCRTEKGLSQEKVAEALGVSRQAVTKWENDRAMPSMRNLLALAELYEVPVENLSQNSAGGQEKASILRTNLTILAIISQAAALNVCIHLSPEVYSFSVGGLLGCKLVPLALTSTWMAHALHYEKNKKQYWKNVKIELLYCAVQFAISGAAYYSGFGSLGTIALAAVCFFYIFVVNPKYMNRHLVKWK